jgi:two-component system response regulator RstA
MNDDPPRLLIVEDDDALAVLLAEYLTSHGFHISRVTSGDEGAERILATEPDLVILDLMLPGASGLDVCRRVRQAYSGAILLLTASRSDADHVAGLELGADDFVTKPIEPRVLLARIRAQLRRLRGSRPLETTTQPEVVEVGPLRLSVGAREARVSGREVPLTSLEFDVVLMLANQAGSVVARADLYTRVLGTKYDGIDRGMDVHVSRIRRKLESAGLEPGHLKSVRGVGYLLASR